MAGNCGTGMGVGSSFSLTLTYEASILWAPYVKSWHIWKDPDAGQDWGQKDKGTKEEEKVGWHHWLNGHEFVQPWGDIEGSGNLAFYSPWDWRRVEPDWVTEQRRTITLTYALYKIRRSSFLGRVSPGWAGSVPCPVTFDFPRNSQVKELDFIG